MLAIGQINKRYLDTKKALALPDAPYLVAMMIAINDFGLQDRVITRLTAAANKHRYENTVSYEEQLLEQREIDLMRRHEWGLIWEALDLFRNAEKKAPSIMACVHSIPALDRLFQIVRPHLNSEKLRRLRNNIAFHFGADFIERALTTLSSDITFVYDTDQHYWYEIADDTQTHLMSREVLKIVNDHSTESEVVAKATDQGLEMRAIKENLISIMLSIVENLIEPALVDAPAPSVR